MAVEGCHSSIIPTGTHSSCWQAANTRAHRTASHCKASLVIRVYIRKRNHWKQGILLNEAFLSCSLLHANHETARGLFTQHPTQSPPPENLGMSSGFTICLAAVKIYQAGHGQRNVLERSQRDKQGLWWLLLAVGVLVSWGQWTGLDSPLDSIFCKSCPRYGTSWIINWLLWYNWLLTLVQDSVGSQNRKWQRDWIKSYACEKSD